jgi:hypothetical protein
MVVFPASDPELLVDHGDSVCLSPPSSTVSTRSR